jgi:uncharacterized protein (DUF58 family)
MTGEIEELFDAEFLGRLRALFFKLRKRRLLRKKGVQQAPSAGFTREFKDHRHYVPGDDYRSVDWRLYARLERMFIRIYEEVQEFHVHILLDRSRSMAEPWPEKRLTGLRLAVALAYLSLVGEHRVSIMSITDDVRREMPPLKGQGHIHDILERMAALEFEGVTDLEGSLRTFRPGRDRRGIVFLISDLFGRSAGEAEGALRHALKWQAETHVIQVVDPHEAEPDLDGELQLTDVETGEVRRMWLTKREIARYRESFDGFVEGIRKSCMRRQVDHVTWTTDRPFEDMFLHLLMRGSQLAGA